MTTTNAELLAAQAAAGVGVVNRPDYQFSTVLANEDTSSQTPADTTVTFTTINVAQYVLDGFIIYEANAADDLELSWSFDGALIAVGAWYCDAVAGNDSLLWQNSAVLPGASGLQWTRISGLLATVNDSSFTLQQALANSETGTGGIRAYSHLTLSRIPTPI